MEGLQKTYRSAMSYAHESTAKLSSFASSLEKTSLNSNSSSGSSVDEQSRLLLSRTPRHSISLWTCSKLCTICFIGGVLVGYTLKRRVHRWASKLLKRLKDD